MKLCFNIKHYKRKGFYDKDVPSWPMATNVVRRRYLFEFRM